MYLHVKCDCVDFVMQLSCKQVVQYLRLKPVCEECRKHYRLRAGFAYDEVKYKNYEEWKRYIN